MAGLGGEARFAAPELACGWIHNGKQPMCLITNVLSKKRLSDRRLRNLQAGWGVELFFRTFKQTFGRRKLRSRKAEHAKLEAEWSLVAVWVVCLLRETRDPPTPVATLTD